MVGCFFPSDWIYPKWNNFLRRNDGEPYKAFFLSGFLPCGWVIAETNQPKMLYLGSMWSWASPDSNKTSIAHTPKGPLKFNLQGNNIDNALLEDYIPVEHHHVWVLSLLDSSLIPIITIKKAENFISPNQRLASHVPFYSSTILFFEKKTT